MLKKTIQYKDLDGNTVEEEFWFGLRKSDLAKLEISHQGGLIAHLEKLVKSQNGKEIVEEFESIITMSVGRRSEDGRRFIRNEEIKQDFLNSDAYSELFMELLDADKAVEFIRGVLPADLDETQPVTTLALPDPQDESAPDWYKEGRAPTMDEIKGASPALLAEAFKRRSEESK